MSVGILSNGCGFCFSVFWDFSHDLYIIYFYFNSMVVWKYTMYGLNSFKFVNICFMTKDMVYGGICLYIVGSYKDCILIGLNVQQISVRSCWLRVLLISPYNCWFSFLLVVGEKREMLKFTTIILNVYFLLSVLSIFASHII